LVKNMASKHINSGYGGMEKKCQSKQFRRVKADCGGIRAKRCCGTIWGKVSSGTGMPGDNAELLKSGTVKSLTLWDPAIAGKAMISLAVKVLNGEEIGAPVDLGVEGYEAMTFREGSSTVLEGEGWIVIDGDNVDSFGF
jgi:simple sugar transport system substrate-binding protein